MPVVDMSAPMTSEFELIARYFARPVAGDGVDLGIGDDSALLLPTPGHQLVVSVDTSVAGVHFPPDAPAHAIGHRALAVSLSDLAAMGAWPRWCLMALMLTETDDEWLAEFARGFHALADTHGVSLAGGDVTRGTLAIGVTVHGELPTGQALTRGGASPGDLIAVTGALGSANGGLAAWQAGLRDLADPLLAAYLLPQPRIEAGYRLRELATAAIDISDGLLADLGHVCAASGVGADIEQEAIPRDDALIERLGDTQALQSALAGGDDYELLIALPAERLEEARAALASIDVPLTPIGRFSRRPGIRGVPCDGPGGWQHFPGAAP